MSNNNQKLEILHKLLLKLNSKFNEGEIKQKSLLIEKEDKELLNKYKNKSIFLEYKITLNDNNFRLEAITHEKDLRFALLYFDHLKDYFKDWKLETGILIDDGVFVFIYKE